MKHLKLIVAVALSLLAIGAEAAFVDNRAPATGGEISVAYKSISVEDLLTELVPQGYAVEYTSPEIPRKKVALNGKGTWEALVARTAAAAQIHVETLAKEKVVRLSLEDESKATTTSGARAAAKAPAPKVETWVLTAGSTVGNELRTWGEKAGWKVIWNMPKDWAVPASTAFQGDFKSAASSVIKNLSANGAMVRAQFFDGNNTLVVNGPGLASQ